MKIRQLCCYVLISVLLPSSFLSAATVNRQPLLINTTENNCYIYENENLTGQPIAVLPPGAAGYVLEDKENTLFMESGNIKGYLQDVDLLKGSDAWKKAEKDFQKEATILSDTIFVYEDEEMVGSISDILCKGDVASILSDKGDVLEIMTSNNVDGFISASDASVSLVLPFAEEIDLDDYNDSASVNQSTFSSDVEYDFLRGVEAETVSGEAISAYACLFVGNPYVWGGDSLLEGTDCSGFVKGVYAKFNITLPRTSFEQRSSGYQVCVGWDEKKVQPGDLVCYDGHIAIYIGNGQIVHAANEKDGIKISKADYREVLCVRRILGSREAINLSSQEKEILCRIVEAEAGGEDFKGKLLVANVILNRVVSTKFPDDVESVVFQRARGTYQFSPIADGRYYEVNVSNETKEAVKTAIKGIDPTQGALYFLNPNISQANNVEWFNNSLEYLFTYGGHAFYR